MQPELESTDNKPAKISPNEVLGCLIWADDLLLLSETESGLNNMLRSLNRFTKDNGLIVNLDKTKVMIFNKTGRHMRRIFYLGNQKVETTRYYKYPGLIVTPSGEINSGLKDLKDRAMKAFFKLKKKLGPFFQSHPMTTIKLFETLIKPILLYCSDFWGILKMPKNNPIENLHMKFCKLLLGVQKQTTNSGVLLELGQVPLHIYAIKNATKNWVRIACDKKANELVTKSYNFGFLEKLTWPYQIETKISQIGMMEAFVNKQNTTHLEVFQRLKDIFHQETFAGINKDSSKLRTYNVIKTKIGIEGYLIANPKINTQDRIALTKFRLSNHDLMIEKGRHFKIEKDKRFCPFCPEAIETEMHFLLHCNTFAYLRRELFSTIRKTSRTFDYLCDLEKFMYLLNSESTIRYVASFLRKSFQCRAFLLEHHKNSD